MTPAEFAARIEYAWSRASATTYTPEDPARGQCSVTAILAHRLLGGDILKTRVGDAWHWYNRIGGQRFDFTVAQFAVAPSYDDRPSDPEDALRDTSAQQLAALSAAFTSGRATR